ncbi:MAG: ABC transporter ATP-binding protein [Bacteroidales bacterium]|nr:ABC transporter ATP-binding protein [Bacteroidales bacterium]MBN2818281.1 ABC transporter ATP-binding protein [Bacteroidales bacterium]
MAELQTRTEPVITVKNMVKKFGGFVANDNLNFEVFKGEIFGFLGANGAGKTTAIKILSGLSIPTSGEIKVAGFDVYTQTELIKRNIGYMSQKFSLYEDLTIKENFRFYAGVYRVPQKEIMPRMMDALAEVGLIKYKDRLISDLPLGWKQKLAFSIATFHNPGIVFLDEPTSGVDPVARRNFWEQIFKTVQKGTTVFVTTHYMDEAEYCNRVSIMDKGKIVALNSPNMLKAAYKVDNMFDLFLKIVR